MVPNKFSIVDFKGFDLAGQYGQAVPGIYDKIVDACWNCGYIMCFGLKFAGFDIAPQYMIPTAVSGTVKLNGIISIDSNDVITIPGIAPLPVINPLEVSANGVYVPDEGVDGFSPVSVDVPPLYIPSTPFIGYSGVVFSNTETALIGDQSTGWITTTMDSPAAPTGSEQVICTKVPIDITNYHRLYVFIASVYIDTNWSEKGQIGISTLAPSSADEAIALASARLKVSSLESYGTPYNIVSTISLDVSSFAGEYYIWFATKLLYNSSGHGNIKFTMVLI